MKRYRRKPQAPQDREIAVAQYVPGAPLDDLRKVAALAHSEAEVAEAPLPGGPVLVARWREYHDEYPSSLSCTVVPAG